jgi:hypothetical protein
MQPQRQSTLSWPSPRGVAPAAAPAVHPFHHAPAVHPFHHAPAAALNPGIADFDVVGAAAAAVLAEQVPDDPGHVVAAAVAPAPARAPAPAPAPVLNNARVRAPIRLNAPLERERCEALKTSIIPWEDKFEWLHCRGPRLFDTRGRTQKLPGRGKESKKYIEYRCTFCPTEWKVGHLDMEVLRPHENHKTHTDALHRFETIQNGNTAAIPLWFSVVQCSAYTLSLAWYKYIHTSCVLCYYIFS